MKRFNSIRLICFLLTSAVLAGHELGALGAVADNPGHWAAPSALVLSPQDGGLYAACAETGQVLALNADDLKIKASIDVGGRASGLAFSKDGRALYVTCSSPASRLAVIDPNEKKVVRSLALGHTALSPVLSPDGATLYVCNRFDNSISVVDLASFKETSRIAVDREPVAAAVTPDGRRLIVAHHLHSGRADADLVAAKVSVIDTTSKKTVQQWQLPNGSGTLRDVRISPDGRYACVTHVLARFQLPTTQLERGWMNSNAMTLIDLEAMAVVNTVLLDNVDSGAANPWACGWAADGQTLFVTHAGTHELSLIDFPKLLAKLAKVPEKADNQTVTDYSSATRIKSDVPNDLAFLVGLRERIKLKGKGPRAAIASGTRVYVAGYYSDTIETVDLKQRQPLSLVESHLSPDQPMSILRRGEFLFNDASICFQGWQSCASCHSDDARVDGLNWDLLNDGIGNPKNSKSLLLSHLTPPVMSLGVRETAETAVRSGIRHILFTQQPEEVPLALDEWLKLLKPIPSPYLVNGELSAEAKKGKSLFESPETRCATCHKAELYTDLKSHDVGTAASSDKPGDKFDVPTMIEIWRTAPYLHDGSAVTVREVLVEHNKSDRHGKTSHLTSQELDELAAYLLSL
jgi:YVTN family beta-propeller protein